MRLIKAKVTVEAKKEAVRRKTEDSFDVSVRASAERGEANVAVLRVLSETLGVLPNKLRIVKGGRSSAKIIEIWE